MPGDILTPIFTGPLLDELDKRTPISLLPMRFVDNEIIEPRMASVVEDVLNEDASHSNSLTVNEPAEQVVVIISSPLQYTDGVSVSEQLTDESDCFLLLLSIDQLSNFNDKRVRLEN